MSRVLLQAPSGDAEEEPVASESRSQILYSELKPQYSFSDHLTETLLSISFKASFLISAVAFRQIFGSI